MKEYKPAYGLSLIWIWSTLALVSLPCVLAFDVVGAMTEASKFGSIFFGFLLVMVFLEILSILFLLVVNLILRRFSRKYVLLYADQVSYEGRCLSLDSIRYVTVHLPESKSRNSVTPLYLVLWADKKNYIEIKRPSPEMILAMKNACPNARFSIEDWRAQLKEIAVYSVLVFVVILIILIFAK